MNRDTPKPLVHIERLLISERLSALGIDIYPYVERHKHGDWGFVTADTKRSNELETKKPAHLRECIHSHHDLPDGTEIRIVTNPQLGMTCVLLSDE